MKWVFYSLFGLNLLCFMFGFFVVDPRSEVQFVEPAPTQIKEKMGRLTLLDERRTNSIKLGDGDSGIQGKSTNASAGEPLANASPGQIHHPEKCYRFGPFSSLKETNEYQSHLDRAGAEWRVQAEPVSSRTSFWVYIPAANSRDEALMTLKNLQISGVDSYIVGKGVDANAISLGTFKKIDSANALKEKLSGLGYQAEISEKKDVKNSYWAFLRLTDESGEPQALEVSKGALVNSIISCEMFAQDKIIP